MSPKPKQDNIGVWKPCLLGFCSRSVLRSFWPVSDAGWTRHPFFLTMGFGDTYFKKLSDVSNPWFLGHMGSTPAMNVAQHNWQVYLKHHEICVWCAFCNLNAWFLSLNPE